jgi:hypothetical protein
MRGGVDEGVGACACLAARATAAMAASCLLRFALFVRLDLEGIAMTHHSALPRGRDLRPLALKAVGVM